MPIEPVPEKVLLQEGEPIWYGMTLPSKKLHAFFGANPHVEDLFRDVLKLRGFTLDPVESEDLWMLRWEEGTRIPLYLRTLLDRLV